ncbi:hypothetical protein, partial [Pseudomonas protegens]|uniref:hypothetical protein n=1 Tax=Pseudomonas protegens TaxID=380021 RepID=UPI0035A5DBCA
MKAFHRPLFLLFWSKAINGLVVAGLFNDQWSKVGLPQGCGESCVSIVVGKSLPGISGNRL